MTAGPQGGLLLRYLHGRLAGGWRYRGVPARLELDPTGAGDTFATAYLAARSGGAAPISAARRAGALVGDFLAGRAA